MQIKKSDSNMHGYAYNEMVTHCNDDMYFIQ